MSEAQCRAIEDRGVIRDLAAPRGYYGYSAVATDGTVVGHYHILQEIETDESRTAAAGRMWDAIERYESQLDLARPALTLLSG